MASFGTSSRARLALLTVFATGILGGACVTQGSPQPEALSSGQLIERADAMFGARNTLETLEAYKLAAVSAQREGNGALFAEATAQVASVLALSAQPTAARNWLDQAQIATNPKEPQAWSRSLSRRVSCTRTRSATPAGELSASGRRRQDSQGRKFSSCSSPIYRYVSWSSSRP